MLLRSFCVPEYVYVKEGIKYLPGRRGLVYLGQVYVGRWYLIFTFFDFGSILIRLPSIYSHNRHDGAESILFTGSLSPRTAL